MDGTPPESAEGPRSFAHFIQQLDYGGAHRELSDRMFELGQAIRESQIDGGKLKVTGELTLKLKLTGEGDVNGPLIINYDVSVKKPRVKKAPSIFWLTKAGNLSTQNPRQAELQFGVRDVTGDAPVVDVGGPDKPVREVRT